MTMDRKTFTGLPMTYYIPDYDTIMSAPEAYENTFRLGNGENFSTISMINSESGQFIDMIKIMNISPIHTFVNIPALIRKQSVFLSSRAEILTKV